ncbi:hypothetical protein [Lysobacter gummosus]|jgi:hypothetical protein|uniref:hypothetical protein n=1 Tax=Lysobacter gummosus TaxID=262324 RepID=UPI003638D4FA
MLFVQIAASERKASGLKPLPQQPSRGGSLSISCQRSVHGSGIGLGSGPACTGLGRPALTGTGPTPAARDRPTRAIQFAQSALPDQSAAFTAIPGPPGADA